MFLLDENWKLQIRRADISDTARYFCKATNIAGTAEKYFDLNVLGKLNQGAPWLNSNESKCYFRSQIYFKSGYIRYNSLFQRPITFPDLPPYYFVVPPLIERANVDTEPRVIINSTIQLNCAVSGIPTPDVRWHRNDEPLSALR